MTMAFLGASTPLESVMAGVIAVGVFGGQPHFHLTSAGTAFVSSDTGSVAVAGDKAMFTYLYHPHINDMTLDSLLKRFVCLTVYL